MTTKHSEQEHGITQELGGRLPLLHPAALDLEQQALHSLIEKVQVTHANEIGYIAQLQDGRLIGPFNAMLRTPELARQLGGWVAAITRATAAFLSALSREVVILTIGVHWRADFVIYAHSIAARRAGLDETDLQAILRGETPNQLTRQARLARQLALRLMRPIRVEPELYADLLQEFGEPELVTLIALIAQYIHTSFLLTCFEVPAPGGEPSEALTPDKEKRSGSLCQ